MVNVKIQLEEGATLPTKAHDDDAGFDLYAKCDEDIVIYPGTNKMINTGIRMAIPPGYFGGIYARSGLSTKQGLRLSNSVGVIDTQYRGLIMVALYNDSSIERVVKNGDRIAQLVIHEIPQISLSIVEKLDETERGFKGFGSSDA